MMTPAPSATISRAAFCATMKAARTFSPSSRSRVPSSTSRKGCGRLTPALLTRMSSRPRPAIASRTASDRVTSKGSARAFPPPEAISHATSSSSLGVRLTTTSSAPAAASASATARPMPRPAPVTSAILPSRRKALSPAMLSADFAGIGFQQAPNCRAGLGPPASVEIAQFDSEAVGIRRVDFHALARELLGSAGIDPFDIVTLEEGKLLGVAFDHSLYFPRQRAPRRGIGEQGEARPPMGGQAEISLHLEELQRQHDAERVALAVKGARLQRIVHLVEWDITRLRPECLEEIGRDRTARAADLQPGEIGGGVNRPGAGRQMMKSVLQAMTEGVDPVFRQLAANLVAQRAIEGCEHGLRIRKSE